MRDAWKIEMPVELRHPLFPCGGRGAEFYAGGQEVRIHVWVKGDRPMLDATLTQIHRMVLSRSRLCRAKFAAAHLGQPIPLAR